MPILILLLLVVIIAQVGFWDTLGALFGVVAVLVIFVLLLAGIVALVASYAYGRVRRRFTRR